MKKYFQCCKGFKEFFHVQEEGSIVDGHFFLIGKQDGKDDNINIYEIFFCPFCGKKLNIGE